VSLLAISHRTGTIQFSDFNYEHTKYDAVAAYAQFKLANIYMANAIERRYSSHSLYAYSVMPGGIWTGLQDSLLHAVVQH
jgi:NAD(P)-dependent dehydrogenase (short-subunit alcohol dehydrogenase family)